jgi:hypothetical protein
VPTLAPGTPLRRVRDQEPVLCDALDWNLIEHSANALEHGGRVELERPVLNTNRCVGGLLSGEIARRHGAAGLPEDSIVVRFEGSAGRASAAGSRPASPSRCDGVANDYTGKGLSGGVLVVRPPADAAYVAEENVIIGNTVLYGATDGRAFFRGLAGRALRGAQLRRSRGRRGRRRSRLRVHDRRARRRARADGPQLRRRHERRRRLRLRRGRGLRAAPLQPLERVGFEELDETDAIELRALVAEHAAAHRLRRRQARCWATGRRAWSAS